jgi:hypothetical protein
MKRLSRFPFEEREALSSWETHTMPTEDGQFKGFSSSATWRLFFLKNSGETPVDFLPGWRNFLRVEKLPDISGVV